MAYHHSNGGGPGGSGMGGDYSGDERESRSGGEERPDSDLHDKPIYLLEHLATFTVNKDSGIVYPADGMRRLLQLEKTTGIWSQKMQLCLDYQWVLIMDYETGNIIERFPATLIQEPTAFTSTDAMELYNNILVFIVSGGSGSRSEMHIFQSQSVSAVHLVEDLKNLRSGKMVTQQREATNSQHVKSASSVVGGGSGSGVGSGGGLTKSMITTSHSRADHQHQQHQQQHLQQHQQQHHSQQTMQQQRSGSSFDQYGMRSVGGGVAGGELGLAVGSGGGGGSGETDSEHGGINDETSSTSSDKYERDVTVLNHCFDDIEKFIARLQHAAAASRELERRRRNRKTKKKDPGEGLLTLRTRPPHEKEFIDIFAKFKLSFNLLAKLKAHIHDPNAPELVHFLFTPLALIVEASSDTYYESQLPAHVVNPLLTREAINLLINCVTSKETELWRSLGDAWIVPRDQWKEDVGSYHPVFLDGWSPDYLVVDELESPHTPTNISKRRLETHHHHHHHAGGLGLGLNGRGAAPVGTGAYDDYDGSAIALNEKYTIHHGHSHPPNERSERGTATAGGGGGPPDYSTRSEISIDSIERSGLGIHHSMTVSNNAAGGGAASSGTAVAQNAAVMQSITAGIQSMHTRESRNSGAGGGAYGGGSNSGNGGSELGGARGGASLSAGDEQLLEAWLEDMQASGAKVVLVTYPRTANNDKELSVVRGEYLEVLDDTRKWWKARNMRGQVAHVPHTIVTPYNYGDNETGNQFYGQHQQQQQQQQQQHLQTMQHHHQQQQSQSQNNYKSRHSAGANAHAGDNIEQRSNDTTDWIRNKHLGKKGEFRYF